MSTPDIFFLSRFRHGAAPAAYKENRIADCVCTTEAAGYHYSYYAKKIGNYDALRVADLHVEKYDRVYCSDVCSTKVYGHASREYEGLCGDC